jgi:hypothetical protein
LAVRMRFRKPDGTFSEGEAQELFGRVINAACQKWSIEVR